VEVFSGTLQIYLRGAEAREAELCPRLPAKTIRGNPMPGARCPAVTPPSSTRTRTSPEHMGKAGIGATPTGGKMRPWRIPLVQNAVALMLSSGGTAVLGVVFWGVVAHLASPERIGDVSAELAALILLANLAQLSFNQIFDRFLPIAGNQTRKFVLRAYGMCSCVALVAGIVYVSAGFGFKFIPSSIGWRAFFVGAVVLWTIFVLQDSVLIGLRASRWVPVENILFSVAKIVLLPVFLAVTTRQGLFLAWTVPVVGATGAVSWYLFRRLIPNRVAASGSEGSLPGARELVSLAAAQYATALIAVFTTSIVALIIIAKLGPVAEADYYLPALIATAFSTLLWNIFTSFLVEASSDPEALREHAKIAIRTAAALVGPIVVITVIFAPEILGLFGHRYANHGTTLLRLLVLSLPGSAVTAFYTSFAWLDRRVWWLAGRDLLGSMVYFVTLLTLINRLGILAVGVASLLSSGVQGVFFLPATIIRFKETAHLAESKSEAPTPALPNS
jgi:O-antigen/teichoic acid export membrane protein